MRIDEFRITRYPPLPDTGKVSLHSFNLFFGRNEDGKTLTIDALIKLMFGQNIKDFERIDRVEENPEGYVIIRDDKNKEFKLPEKGSFTKITGLTSAECRNIFVIRDSDLSLVREGDFYTTLTDRLMGLRTRELARIKESLREIGKLTPSNTFRDSKGEKLKTRIEKSTILIEKIDSLSDEIKKEDFDGLEEEQAQLTEDIKDAKRQKENLEDSRKREKFEKGKQALDKLTKDLDAFEELKDYNSEDEQTWRNHNRDVQESNKNKADLLEELEESKKKSDEISERLNLEETNYRLFEVTKKELDEEIRPNLKDYKLRSEEIAGSEKKRGFFNALLTISTIVLTISLLGLVFNPLVLFFILAMIFSTLIAASCIRMFQFARNKAWLAKTLRNIALTISKYELNAENIEGVLLNIQRFDEKYLAKADEVQDLKREKERWQAKVDELQDQKIPTIEKRIDEAEEAIDAIKRKSKEISLEGYSGKLELKENLERSIGEQTKILENLFERKSRKVEENISQWNKEITDLEEYKNKAAGVKYSEKTLSAFSKKENELNKKLEEAAEKASSTQEKLTEIEVEANKTLQPEERLCCKTLVDLRAIKEDLQKFVDENENLKDNTVLVIQFFEEIEKEEKDKVSKLFGNDSPISKYFSEISGKLYEEVKFNQELSEIEVRRKDGIILGAEKLSGGTFDQLYLAVRLALGEKLLKSSKGFFIMDDPFIKADTQRLRRQIEILKRISEVGWQIIYFTAKDEIKDVLKNNIKNEEVNYIETQPIFL